MAAAGRVGDAHKAVLERAEQEADRRALALVEADRELGLVAVSLDGRRPVDHVERHGRAPLARERRLEPRGAAVRAELGAAELGHVGERLLDRGGLALQLDAIGHVPPGADGVADVAARLLAVAVGGAAARLLLLAVLLLRLLSAEAAVVGAALARRLLLLLLPLRRAAILLLLTCC